jgi:hypothetical protein
MILVRILKKLQKTFFGGLATRHARRDNQFDFQGFAELRFFSSGVPCRNGR